MVDLAQGKVWWAELPVSADSGPGFRRPVVVVQGASLNRSRLATAACVPRTSDLTRADAPGNVLVPARSSGLPRDSVANASPLVVLDRAALAERVGQLGPTRLAQVLSGIDVVLGR